MATATITITTTITSPFPLHRSLPSALFANNHRPTLSFPSSIKHANTLSPLRCSHAAISSRSHGAFDPELRYVLELATDSELYELEQILFGPSYFSPLLKSITSKRSEVDYGMIEHDLEERDDYISSLESRFLFLAADARSTLRGWRPTYRNVLLTVRQKLNIPCSSKLSTEDLEAEIFLHLVEEYASEESGTFPGLWEISKASEDQASLGFGLSQQKVQAAVAQKLGASDLKSIILKGGGMFTLTRIYQWLARKLTGKVFLEAASYQMKKEIIKKGGQLAAINLESRAALLAAKQGFVGAASRYLGLRSMMSLLGPIASEVVQKYVDEHASNMLKPIINKLKFWGTFLADVVIQMLGTDYARILRAIYAFAQIRITRTYRLPCDKD